jgi:hypothetical protein
MVPQNQGYNIQVKSYFQLVTSRVNKTAALLLEYLGFEDVSLMTCKEEENNAFLSRRHLFILFIMLDKWSYWYLKNISMWNEMLIRGTTVRKEPRF